MLEEFMSVRKSKIEVYETETKNKAYASKFKKDYYTNQLGDLDDGFENITTAGRLVSLRDMGKLIFLHIQDSKGKFQCSLNKSVIGDNEFNLLVKTLDLGDFIGVEGEMFTTKRGEKTLRAHKCILLSKALRPLPEKWHGISDPEIKVRQRYLDLLTNDETWKRFETRNKFIRLLRNYLQENEFLEVETPILQSIPSGAMARPFITHHNALDIPLYLRIAPETFLKRLTVGGYEKIFEIGKCFRNEGVDPSHLQEFTMLEYYAAYWDFKDNLRFIKKLLQEIITKVNGSLKINYDGTDIDFSGDWPEISFRDLLLKDTGIDINSATNLATLREAIKNRNFELEEYASYAATLDALYKKYSRPKLIQPIFVTHQPSEMVPLARQSDEDTTKLDMFQLLVNGWEVIKSYSELVDPVKQKDLLIEQEKLNAAGDDEAMVLDDDFILAMEYGMPIMSGLGLGIDRFVALLTNAKSIRDVVYFPSLRSMNRSELDE